MCVIHDFSVDIFEIITSYLIYDDLVLLEACGDAILNWKLANGGTYPNITIEHQFGNSILRIGGDGDNHGSHTYYDSEHINYSRKLGLLFGMALRKQRVNSLSISISACIQLDWNVILPSFPYLKRISILNDYLSWTRENIIFYLLEIAENEPNLLPCIESIEFSVISSVYNSFRYAFFQKPILLNNLQRFSSNGQSIVGFKPSHVPLSMTYLDVILEDNVFATNGELFPPNLQSLKISVRTMDIEKFLLSLSGCREIQTLHINIRESCPLPNFHTQWRTKLLPRSLKEFCFHHICHLHSKIEYADLPPSLTSLVASEYLASSDDPDLHSLPPNLTSIQFQGGVYLNCLSNIAISPDTKLYDVCVPPIPQDSFSNGLNIVSLRHFVDYNRPIGTDVALPKSLTMLELCLDDEDSDVDRVDGKNLPLLVDLKLKSSCAPLILPSTLTKLSLIIKTSGTGLPNFLPISLRYLSIQYKYSVGIFGEEPFMKSSIFENLCNLHTLCIILTCKSIFTPLALPPRLEMLSLKNVRICIESFDSLPPSLKILRLDESVMEHIDANDVLPQHIGRDSLEGWRLKADNMEFPNEIAMKMWFNLIIKHHHLCRIFIRARKDSKYIQRLQLHDFNFYSNCRRSTKLVE